jgi:hypothetical protein
MSGRNSSPKRFFIPLLVGGLRFDALGQISYVVINYKYGALICGWD